MPRLSAILRWAALLPFLAACDSGRDPADSGSDAMADGEHEAGSDSGLDGPSADVAAEEGEVVIEPDPGLVTLIASETRISSERLFDLDGDGALDNAVTDLGDPAAGIFASVLSAGTQAYIDDGRRRTVVHFPFVEDRATPNDAETPMALLDGVDLDDPPDPTDDFTGVEPFYAFAENVDACGEPLYVFDDSRIDGGLLSARADRASFGINSTGSAYGVHLAGLIAPGARAAELDMGMYVLASELGLENEPSTGLSNLEFFLAGGAPIGVAGVDGLSPDIDVDGDGLERFVLDGAWHITQCIDGDSTIIPGRDCWQDDRIADGFSLTMRMTFVPAVLVGLEPGWEDVAIGECAAPPADSFWDGS